MTHIITLTPSPAIDVSTSVAKMAPFTKLRGARPERHPGGGINVARVISRLGGDVIAVYPAGGVMGQYLRQLMDREAVSSLTIRTADETREDLTVFEQSTKQQYRFVLPGAELSEPEWTACLAAVAGVKPAPEFNYLRLTAPAPSQAQSRTNESHSRSGNCRSSKRRATRRLRKKIS